MTGGTGPEPARHPGARRRDRRVYLRSHPLLFALLAATRRRPVARLGRTVLVHGAEAYREALTRIPLDRTAPGTTGGAAAELTYGGALFDQEGAEHRTARRELAAALDSAAVDRLRPRWQAVLADRVPALATGELELVALSRALAGLTAAALTGATGCPHALAGAAAEAAAAAARDHLPGPRPRDAARRAAARAADLADLLPDPGTRWSRWPPSTPPSPPSPGPPPGARTPGSGPRSTPPARPRWPPSCSGSPPLAAAPRVAAADAELAGRAVRKGDRLVLVARHAAGAHRPAPSPGPAAAQAVFGAGPHACPGAGAARALLADLLLALAPYAPVVTGARVDRRSALPGWAALTLRATRAPA
ncbi:cytochrome P450 [Kitasatospora purpeofusca]|uniref:cytochrome P450 n=1 Tax=Kitasatospora purpeofusca TaxID=67352 RepID=UPI0036D323F6